MRQKDIRPAPARIEFKGMKFLITDRPSDATIQSYLMVCLWEHKRSKFKKYLKFLTENIFSKLNELFRFWPSSKHEKTKQKCLPFCSFLLKNALM